jgi:Ser/Thr protein kinase RdoA (MazF antagonist)
MDQSILKASRGILEDRFPAARIRLVSQSHNAIYHVVQPDGQPLAARLGWLGRPLAWTQAEALWLSHLHDYSIAVPRPLSDPESIEIEGHSAIMLLMDWIEGERLTSRWVTPVQAQEAAMLLARVHRATALFPDTHRELLTRPILDGAGLRGEGLSQYAVDAEGQRLLLPYASLLDTVAERTAEALAVLDESGAKQIMIHGDFRPENIVETETGLALLDFDDCAWGYAAYDLATFLMFTRGSSQAEEVRLTLWQTYQGMTGAPDIWEPVLDVLMLSRFALSLRWAVNNRGGFSGDVGQILRQRASLIELALSGQSW